MTPDAIATEQTALRGLIDAVYERNGEPLSKKDFLSDSWHAIANFVRYNKENLLIQEAVRQYPDLILRTFVVLSVLYGAYTYAPRKVVVLKDFVAMLGKDLMQEELRVCTYAKTKGAGSFFPELSRAWATIQEIYGAERSRSEALPVTPYRAYALYVLNHSGLLGKNISPEEISEHLSADEGKLRQIVAHIKSSGPEPESAFVLPGNRTLH